jgi:hypothetical protein
MRTYLLLRSGFFSIVSILGLFPKASLSDSGNQRYLHVHPSSFVVIQNSQGTGVIQFHTNYLNCRKISPKRHIKSNNLENMSELIFF